MRFSHSNIYYYLDDEWWTEAGMQGFRPPGRSYCPDPSAFPNLPTSVVSIDEVEPLKRKGSHGVFNDSPEYGTAHDRVVRILRGFRDGLPIPPVKVAQLHAGQRYKFKLVHGAHRFYCAVASGFSHVPAVEVDDVWGGNC